MTRKDKIQPYNIWEEEIKPVKLHPSKKRSARLTLPHPGQSYNPDPEDHRRFLKKIVKLELDHQKEERKIARALKVPCPASIKEVDDGDSGDETDPAYSDYDEKDFEIILADKKVEEKRKTKRQRLGQLRDKLQRKAAKLRKLKNIRLSKFDAVKKIYKELDKKAKEEAEKQAKKHRRSRKERLGPKFEPSDPVYCLGSELPSNLLSVKCPMDAIVRDQLESFQARLLVEPTKWQIKKSKYKRKQYERRCADEKEH